MGKKLNIHKLSLSDFRFLMLRFDRALYVYIRVGKECKWSIILLRNIYRARLFI